MNVPSDIVRNVGMLLDIGCGIKPTSIIEAGVHICVDVHREYLEKISRERYVLINCDWETVTRIFPPRSVDTVVLLDVIEHLEKQEGKRLLAMTEAIARKQVVIFTPDGFLPQSHPDGIDAWGLHGGKWQEHKSGWTKDDFDVSWRIHIEAGFFPNDNMGRPLPRPMNALWAIKEV